MFRAMGFFKPSILITIFFFSLAFTGFSQRDSLTTYVSISGKIIGADTSKKLTFRFYKDYLTFEELNYTTSIVNDSFSIDIPLSTHTPGFIAYGALNVPIFLDLGDQLIVDSYASTFVDSLKFSGKGALANNYLQETFLLFDSKDTKRVEAGISQNTATGFHNLMTQFKQDKIDFLKTYLTSRDTQFTKNFEAYVRSDINYWFGYNLMRYRNEHPASDVLPVPLTLPENYFAFTDSLEINNETALKNINYLTYIDHYAKWREERIEKGLLKFNDVEETTKQLVKINMVETFAHVLMEKLEVRAKAHDENSSIAQLERGDEVLYLQDITSDQFIYDYQGHKYSDKFLKVELQDGSFGWVFRGGIILKEKLVSAKKWVEIPDTSPEAMRNFKYASFKGKVLHYAVAKDLYWEALKGDKTKKKLIEEYIVQLPDDEYVATLRSALAVIQTDSASTVLANAHTPLPVFETKMPDTTGTCNKLLKEITAVSAMHLQLKKETVPETNLEEIEIEKPNFESFQRLITLKGYSNHGVINRPEIVVNTNPLLRENTVFPFEEKATAPFNYNISLKSSTTAELRMGKEVLNLYLQPGNELEIAVNGNDLYSQTVFSGTGSKINNYLLAAANEFKKTNQEIEVKIRYADPTAFKDFLFKVKNDKLAFLRIYLESHTLSAHLINYAKADIDYWYAFNLMNYPYEHPIFHDQPSPMAVPANYYDFMDEIALNNDGAIPNKQYIYYVQAFLSYKSGETENKGLDREQIADKYLKAKSLYFYKAIQLSNEAKRNDSPKIKEKVAHFIKNCPYRLYVEFVKLAYHEGRGMVEGVDAPEFSLTDIDGNLVSLADYKGKVVFLDFWATWCVPCIHQLPSHEKLQQKFVGQEVVFLYVSVDQNAEKWKNFVRSKSLPGVHLTAGEKKFNSTVSKDYKVSSLPYTLLIDSTGKIAWHHTGAYSVEELGGRIAQLLN